MNTKDALASDADSAYGDNGEYVFELLFALDRGEQEGLRLINNVIMAVIKATERPFSARL